MKNAFYYDTNIGKIGIAEEENMITNLFFADNGKLENVLENETMLIKKAKKELEEYFEGKRKVFTLPLSPKGTTFMKKVWALLEGVPYGETASYKDIAKKAGNEKACRAVGMANNKNPIAIIIPCHRIIGKNGKLVGYAGRIRYKRKIIKIRRNYDLESLNKNCNYCNLESYMLE